MYLTEDTDPEDAIEALTPRRSSQARRKELERIATLCTPRDIDIHVRLTTSGAACRPRDAPDSYEIQIPTRQYDQPYSDFDSDVWDRLMQVTLLFHELGHVLYSGFDRFTEYIDEIRPRWQSLFKDVYNIAEDAAIEAQMAAAFRLHDDFILKSASLAHIADRRHREFVTEFSDTAIPDSVQTVLPVAERLTMSTASDADESGPSLQYTVYEALSLALMDRGTINSDRCRKLQDPACSRRQLKGDYRDLVVKLDAMAGKYMADMLSEPNPRSRVDRAKAFFDELQPIFEDLPPLQRDRLQTPGVTPSDVIKATEWNPREASRLTTKDESPGVTATASVGQMSVGSTDRNDELTTLEIDRDRRHHTGIGSDTARQQGAGVTDLVNVVNDDDSAVDQIRIFEPDDETDHADRWTELRRAARRLEHQLRSRLRKERRPQKRPRARRGNIDNRELVRAVQGSDRVFTRLTPGKDKDYSCQLFLDRSGSMNSSIEAAETAVCQLAAALYAVGVDVSVCSLYESVVSLELPFGARPASCTDRLLAGRTGGGTPLSEAVTVARHRAGHGSGTVPFVIIVTDGIANDVDAYERAVDRCHCPVFGVYLNDKYDHDTYFDQVVYTTAGDIGPAIQDLARTLFRRQV